MKGKIPLWISIYTTGAILGWCLIDVAMAVLLP